jgi:hypothetical protein
VSDVHGFTQLDKDMWQLLPENPAMADRLRRRLEALGGALGRLPQELAPVRDDGERVRSQATAELNAIAAAMRELQAKGFPIR